MTNYVDDNSFPKLILGGLTGATAGGRFVGFVASGAPASGTFLTNDIAYDIAGKQWQLCTAGGSPGTWGAAGGGGDLVKISTQTASGAVASLSFTSIPGSYAHLLLVGMVRASDSATRYLELQFNADTGSNYGYQWVYNNANTTAAGNAGASTAGILIGQIADGTATATHASPLRVEIPRYADTTWKRTVTGQTGDLPNTAGTGFISSAATGFWSNTAAITRVDVLANTGNLASGSSCTLYGLNG